MSETSEQGAAPAGCPVSHHRARNPQFTEVHESPFRAVFPVFDDEGHLMGEGNAPRELFARVPINWQKCKYPGSRKGKPMNVSGLKQMTQQWEELLALLASLRSEYMKRHGLTELSILHLWKLAMTACVLPHYLMQRAEKPMRDGEIPGLVASLYKLMAGIFQTMEHMVSHGMALGVDLQAPTTPEELINYADEHEVYQGRDGVCSGPPHLIKESVELVVVGKNVPEGVTMDIRTYVPDLEAFFSFGAASLKLDLAKRIFTMGSIIIDGDLRRAWQEVEAPAGQTSAGSQELRGKVSSYLEALPSSHPVRMMLESDIGRELGHNLAAKLCDEIAVLGRVRHTAAAGDFIPLNPEAQSSRRQERIDRLMELCSGVADPRVLRCLLSTLDDCLQLERSSLGFYAAIQEEINGTLGRASGGVPDEQDMAASVEGGTLRERLVDWLGLEVSFTPGTALVRRGGQQVDVG